MKKFFYLLSIAMMLVVAIASCSVEDNSTYQPVIPPEAQSDTARLTVIFYGTVGGDADNQPETAWEIMKPYLKKKDVRVVVCYKYAKPIKFRGRFAKPGDVVFFELTDTTDLSKIGDNYAVNWPDLALFSEETLTSVIDISTEMAPARDYIFLLYGHGGGFDQNVDFEKDKRKIDSTLITGNRAVLYDEWIPTAAGSEGMNMYEFLRGIAYSKVPHFKSIFFHNCLMGGVETLFDISLVCDYTVTSSHMLAMNQAPIRQFIKAISEQTDLEKAYLQMFNGMLPEWESGYAPYRFNGDLKLINSEKLFKYVIEPSKKLADRLIELYPTMQAQIDTAMIHTYQYLNLNGFYDLSDYANKVAEYTKDPQLISIAKELDEALDKAILGRQEIHLSPLGDLPKFTLSVVLCSQDAYKGKTAWDYTVKEAYEYSNWHLFTGWGDWLNTTKQSPLNQSQEYKGQPVGQFFFESE